jgi:hypothetical protein
MNLVRLRMVRTTVKLAAVVLISLLANANTSYAQEAALNLTLWRPASFLTTLEIKNVGSQVLEIQEIVINNDPMCEYKLWRKVSRRDCNALLPGTGGYFGGAGKGTVEIFPIQTVSMTKEDVKSTMEACGWEQISSKRLGLERDDYKFVFSIFKDNDNNFLCSNYRELEIRTSSASFNWRFDPEQNPIP